MIVFRKLIRWLTLAAAAFTLAGCTYVRYDRLVYVSVLQKKSLAAEMDDQGKIKTLKYNTDSDAVADLARTVETLATKVQ